MTCKECFSPLGYEDHKKAMDLVGVELCERHRKLIENIIKEKDTPKEAIQLYYALKNAGVNPMLEWWDGNKSVDIAISRVKLNIDIGTDYELMTHKQALGELEEAMHSFKNGFTNIRIPHILVKYYLKDTVKYVIGIIEGLKVNLKAV
ncbi:hypothetical protein GCM10011414_14840 [Croceivirga lutea]|uniref:hypothetical protein n=1 Tax=Croceivirga lutea TaxID=1775167 RepID=UPI0016396224|nr:hypothetical protein [Croceivirga lutea]GGG46248.1 hypothetical protein GCM10011414_14840 [Croceivirga lutea]